MSTRNTPRYKRLPGSCNWCGKQTGKDIAITRDGYGYLCRVWDCPLCSHHTVEYVKTGT